MVTVGLGTSGNRGQFDRRNQGDVMYCLKFHGLFFSILVGVTCVTPLVAQQDIKTREQNVKIDAWLSEEIGATVVRDYAQPTAPLTEIEFPAPDAGWVENQRRGRMTLEIFQRLSELSELEALSLLGTRFKNKDLAYLQRMSSLRTLKLSSPPLDETGMQHIGSITGLRSLALDHLSHDFDIQWLKHLRSLSTLQEFSMVAISPNGLLPTNQWNYELRQSLQKPAEGRKHRLHYFRGGISDADLPLLAGLPLRSLFLTRNRITNQGLQKLVEMFPNLRELHLDETDIRDSGIDDLSALKKLEILKLKRTPITLKEGPGLSQLKSLKSIDLEGSLVSNHGVAQLAQLKNLEYVNLTHTHTDGETLKALEKLLTLKRLSLKGTRVGFQALKRLATANQHLELSELLISRGWAKLNRRGQITTLNLANMNLHDEDLQFLTDLPLLEILDLRKNNLTNDGMLSLTSLTQLRRLKLDENPINDMGIVHLAPIEKLSGLSVKKTDVTLSGLHDLFVAGQNRTPREALQISGFSLNQRTAPDAWDLNLTRTHAGDDDMVMVGAMEGLFRLKLVGNEITNHGIEQLKGHRNLNTLWIEEAGITGKALVHLAKVPGLMSLWCPDATFRNEDLAPLAKMASLKVLNLCGCPIDDGALPYLKNLAHLNFLIVDTGQLSEATLKALRDSCPDLSIHESQRTALALLRNRKRVRPRLEHGGTLVDQFSGIRATVLEDEAFESLIRDFGDEFFEVATRCMLNGKAVERLGDDFRSLRYLTTVSSLSIINARLPEFTVEVLNELPDLVELSLYRTNLDKVHLHDLNRLTRFTSLELGRSSITSQQLRLLPPMPELKVLRLGGYGTSVSQIEFLQTTPKLEQLDLSRTDIDDEDLATVASLARLKVFTAYETNISDVGLKHLKNLKHLERLNLNSTEISDAGLDELKGLKSLKQVSARKTAVSGEGDYPFEVRSR